MVEWTVSRTDQNRRISKDNERLLETNEAFIYPAMTRLIVKEIGPLVRFFDRSLVGGFSVSEGTAPVHDSSLKEHPRDRRHR